MQQRFRTRLHELEQEAIVPPGLLQGLLPRLQTFLVPFLTPALSTPEQQLHARHYVAGLISNLKRKNAEGIAYLHDQERQGLQKFLGQHPWEYRPLLTELVRQVGTILGEPDAVLVFDPSAFPKKGNSSVGVKRQWCGRLGKVDNCQVGIYLAYASRVEHALVDVRLFLPNNWAADKTRRIQAGVPKNVRFQTRHELALEMLDEHGDQLPHAWITGDDEMGRSSWFRTQLRERAEPYLLAVPSNTAIRDLEAAVPPYTGRGRRPQQSFQQVQTWCAQVPEESWQRVEVRAGEKGPICVDAVQRRVQARTPRGGPEEVLLVTRERQGDGTCKHDYYLGHGRTVLLAEYVRVAKAEHRVEEGLQRAKSEAGLGDYQVRTWTGWHHHQALSLLASWFLLVETRAGKKNHASVDGATGALVPREIVRGSVRLYGTGLPFADDDALSVAQ